MKYRLKVFTKHRFSFNVFECLRPCLNASALRVTQRKLCKYQSDIETIKFLPKQMTKIKIRVSLKLLSIRSVQLNSQPMCTWF